MKQRARSSTSGRTESSLAVKDDPAPSPDWRRPPPRKRKWLLIAVAAMEIAWVLLLIVLGWTQ
jgi:hypothetical protein